MRVRKDVPEGPTKGNEVSKEAKELVLAINTLIFNAGRAIDYGLPVTGQVPTIPGKIERLIDKALRRERDEAFKEGTAYGEHIAAPSPSYIELKAKLASATVALDSARKMNSDFSEEMAKARAKHAAELEARNEKIRELADHRQRAESVAGAVTEALRGFLVDAAKRLGTKAINTNGDSFILISQLEKLLVAVDPKEAPDEMVELMNHLAAERQEVASLKRSLAAAQDQIVKLSAQSQAVTAMDVVGESTELIAWRLAGTVLLTSPDESAPAALAFAMMSKLLEGASL